jgi:hypothetical protein
MQGLNETLGSRFSAAAVRGCRGKTTAISINKEYPKDPGVGKPPLGVDRYKTQNRADYGKENFRRIVHSTLEPADVIDTVDTLNL